MNNVLENIKMLPEQPGIYFFKDSDSEILYIGKSKNLKKRVSSYFLKNKTDIKTINLISKVYYVDYIITDSEMDALLLENNLIKKHKPKYNVLLKDSKTYPYIKLTVSDDFPKMEIVRKVEKDKDLYFGPYISGVSPKQLVDIISYTYKIRVCNLNLNANKKTKRECIYYFLGMCSGPCTGRISKQEYRKSVNKAIEFLNGNNRAVKQVLNNKMEKAVELEQFELAIKLRDQLSNFNILNTKLTTQLNKLHNVDAIAFYEKSNKLIMSIVIVRNGKIMGTDNKQYDIDIGNVIYNTDYIILDYYDNKLVPDEVLINNEKFSKSLDKALSDFKNRKVNLRIPKKGYKKRLIDMAFKNAEQYFKSKMLPKIEKTKKYKDELLNLKKELDLAEIPERIECYDISNNAGDKSVASMVVLINGLPRKKYYRKFKLKTIEGPNDFESMKEVLKRRLARIGKGDVSFDEIPDLIVIDGGKGQLSSAASVLNVYDLDKTPELISIAKKEEIIYKYGDSREFKIDDSKLSKNIIKIIRDESHRFAIDYHRKLMNKEMRKSVLEEIKGIGLQKRKIILEKFGSIYNIRDATIEEISVIPGITKEMARKIKIKIKEVI